LTLPISGSAQPAGNQSIFPAAAGFRAGSLAFRLMPVIIHLTENGGSLIFPLCCLSNAAMCLNCYAWQYGNVLSQSPAARRSCCPSLPAATRKNPAGKETEVIVFLACYLPATAEK